jgi:hypothetical protein
MIFSLTFCAFIAMAQVTSTYFRNKDAFASFPELKLSKLSEIPTKRMPQVDTEKLLKEDRETEYMENTPYRFICIIFGGRIKITEYI